jgi:hypothetical protein
VEARKLAGDWIKIETSTPDKPEVDTLAAMLQSDPNLVLGALVRLWCWADQQTVDGNALVTTMCALDRHAGMSGLAQAMTNERIGWLIDNGDGTFSIPNYERHNGQSAKSRALTSRRVKKHRKRLCNDADVNTPLPEKRREEKSNSSARSGFQKPTVDEVIEYGVGRGMSRQDCERMHDYYESKGWKVGKSPMKDWMAATRNWQRNSPAYEKGSAAPFITGSTQRDD